MVSRRGTAVAAVLLAGMLASSLPAALADKAGRAELPGFVRECFVEKRTYCAETKLASGQVLACLLHHAEHASPACKRELDVALKRAELGARIPQCRRAMRALCSRQRTPSAIAGCLDREREQLSPRCREQLDAELSRNRVCDPANPAIPI